MTPIKITLFVMLMTTLFAKAQIVPALYEEKSWKQVGSRELEFLGGNVLVDIFDGFFTDGGEEPNGIIFVGDFDGDGLDDGGATVALTSVTGAIQLEAFRDDVVRLYAAPAESAIERPFTGFRDLSFTVWWDLTQSFGVREYTLAGYTYEMAFPASQDGNDQQDREIVPGVYTFEVPALNDPVSRYYPNIQVSEMLEAYPGRVQTILDQGFRFTNSFESTGRIEFDPRGFNQLMWEGVNAFNVAPTDQVSISMLDAAGDPFVSATGITFPTFFLENDKYDGEYTIVPFFFRPGDLVTAQLSIQRGDPTVTPFPSGHLGTRAFQVDIEFIDTYVSFARFDAGFPPGTSEGLKAPDADFDGDGFSNFLEFILNTDPADNASFPGSAGPLTTPADSGVNPGVLTVTSLADGRCEISIDKRSFTGGNVMTNFEHSEDLLTWITIPSDGDVNGDGDNTDPGDWVVTDVVIDENVLAADMNGDGDMTDVFSRLTATSVSPITAPTVPAGPPSCFFRFTATMN